MIEKIEIDKTELFYTNKLKDGAMGHIVKAFEIIGFDNIAKIEINPSTKDGVMPSFVVEFGFDSSIFEEKQDTHPNK